MDWRVVIVCVACFLLPLSTATTITSFATVSTNLTYGSTCYSENSTLQTFYYSCPTGSRCWQRDVSSQYLCTNYTSELTACSVDADCVANPSYLTEMKCLNTSVEYKCVYPRAGGDKCYSSEQCTYTKLQTCSGLLASAACSGVALGAACGKDEDCSRGLACFYNASSSIPYSCQTVLETGGSCATYSTLCPAGYACNTATHLCTQKYSLSENTTASSADLCVSRYLVSGACGAVYSSTHGGTVCSANSDCVISVTATTGNCASTTEYLQYNDSIAQTTCAWGPNDTYSTSYTTKYTAYMQLWRKYCHFAKGSCFVDYPVVKQAYASVQWYLYNTSVTRDFIANHYLVNDYWNISGLWAIKNYDPSSAQSSLANGTILWAVSTTLLILVLSYEHLLSALTV